jgi:plastocyanin
MHWGIAFSCAAEGPIMKAHHWLFALLLLAGAPAFGATYSIGIGDDCDVPTLGGCFYPAQLTIRAGDTVEFYGYVDVLLTSAHNVVADDGSFRCALGCDGDGNGGNGTPIADIFYCGNSGCVHDPNVHMHFARQFNAPGIVKYHDEVSGAAGVIIVGALPIQAGHTGSWFNPAQIGHGLMLEVLPGSPMRLLAGWFTFAPQGGQSWITGVGPIIGSQAEVQGYQTAGSGGRFPPNFDAANVRQEPWGTLTFTFSDCQHGRVDWVSTVAGYGSGGMDLTRLTLPAGLTC